jgi:hypothetical protein
MIYADADRVFDTAMSLYWFNVQTNDPARADMWLMLACAVPTKGKVGLLVPESPSQAQNPLP